MWCGDEAFQVERPDTTFEWYLLNIGKLLLFYRLRQKMGRTHPPSPIQPTSPPPPPPSTHPRA